MKAIMSSNGSLFVCLFVCLFVFPNVYNWSYFGLFVVIDNNFIFIL